MDYGFIIVEVFDSKTLKPLKSGEIIIYKYKSPNIVFYKEIDKNFSGKTQRIKVQAPDKSLSEYPVQNGKLPYSLYDVKIKSKGYIDSLIIGVQVFPQVTAVQRVYMMVLPKGVEEGSMTNIIVIPPNTLVGNRYTCKSF